MINTVIHLQFLAYGSWDSLFLISMGPNCKLMSPELYFSWQVCNTVASWDSLKAKLCIPETKLCLKDAGCADKKITDETKGTSHKNYFYGLNFALNRFKTCAVSMSNTGKQQFTANQSIYQLSDTRLAIDRSIFILTRPVVITGFNRSLLVDWWSIGRLKNLVDVKILGIIYPPFY